MIKTQKIQNGPVSVRGAAFEFWIFGLPFVSVRGAAFEIRISDFLANNSNLTI
ncbi:MAG: hypothetical protein HW419_4297 [Deltaproteobacteria bacterium]|nr:hypothetical protein [Deltaproteobacteria bacterium]